MCTIVTCLLEENFLHVTNLVEGWAVHWYPCSLQIVAEIQSGKDDEESTNQARDGFATFWGSI